MEAEVKFEGVVEVKPFLEVLQFIGGYVSEVYFEIKEDTMIFKFINPEITVTSQIELPFYSVEKKAELAYGLDVARLLDVLPIILEGAETATIKIGSVKTYGSFEGFIVEYGKFRYVAALIDQAAVRKPKVDIHELAKEFEEEGCRVEVDMETLKEIIKTASHEFLYFDLSPDFNFIHNGTKRFEVEGWVCYEVIDNCYRVEYLQPLLSLKSVEKFVMYVPKEKPIVIKNEVWTPYDLITIVAPYIPENVEELKEQFEQKAGELVLSVSEDVFKVYKRSLKAMSVSYLAIKGGVAYFMEGLPDTPSSIVRFEDMETASINVDEAYYEIGRDFKELVRVADSLELYQSDNKLYMLGTEVGERTDPIPIPEVEGHEIELTKDEYKSLVELSKEKYRQIVVYHRYLFLANIGTEHVELGPRIELLSSTGLQDLKVYEFERLAKYGDHATLVVGDKLHILHIKEVKKFRMQFEVRWDIMYPDPITKEHPNVQEKIYRTLGIEEKPQKVEEKPELERKANEWLSETEKVVKEFESLESELKRITSEIVKTLEKPYTVEDIESFRKRLGELAEKVTGLEPRVKELLDRGYDIEAELLKARLTDLAKKVGTEKEKLEKILERIPRLKEQNESRYRLLNTMEQKLEKEKPKPKIDIEKIKEIAKKIEEKLKGIKEEIEKIKITPENVDEALRALDNLDATLKQIIDKINPVLEELEKDGLEKTDAYEMIYDQLGLVYDLRDRIRKLRRQAEEVKKKPLTDEELRSILETIKYTLSPERLKEKAERFPWERMTPEQRKIVKEAIEKRLQEIEIERKIQKLYELLKQLIEQAETVEELEAAEQKVRQSPLTDIMKEDLLRMIEEKKKQIERTLTQVEIQYLYNLFNEFIDICTTIDQLRFVEEKVKLSPLPEDLKRRLIDKIHERIETMKPVEVKPLVVVKPPVEVKPPTPMSPEIEKELRYLEVQKQLGMKMHPQIEASIKKLEMLGYTKDKIEEIRKWFE